MIYYPITTVHFALLIYQMWSHYSSLILIVIHIGILRILKKPTIWYYVPKLLNPLTCKRQKTGVRVKCTEPARARKLALIHMPLYKLCWYMHGKAYRKTFYILLLTIIFPLKWYHWRKQPTKVEVEKQCPNQKFLHSCHHFFTSD